jgi:hypothetical protein
MKKRNIYSVKIIALLFLSFIIIPSCTDKNKRADLFIATNGSDDNPGTLEKPFLTPEMARNAVREIKKAGRLPSKGLNVWFRGGDYPVVQSLEFSDEDSGTPSTPVTWQSYNDEKVRFIGGRVITGFQSVKDEFVLSRLDKDAGEKIVVADLRSQGIDDYGMLKSRGFDRPATPAHGELFFNGMPMTLARWPNTGEWAHITKFPVNSGFDDGHGTILGELKSGFYYDNDRPLVWKTTENVWMHGYWAYDWANSYERVAEINSKERFVKTAEPYGNYGFIKNQRFYFVNILEELDQPGEWYLDSKTGMLYFWPPSPVDKGEALFSLLEQPVIKMVDASYITVQGIIIEATRGNAIEISGGEGNCIKGCIVRNVGNWAVTILGGKNNGVRSCDISDTGDGGVTLKGGDRMTLTPANHFVENCRFQRQGRWSKCYVPAISLIGVGMKVSHNLISDHPHCAILFTGNDHLIEFNEIHHVALETGDVGAIYTGRDYTFRGNRICNNYIHETGGVGMGSMGVYMDDCVSGTEVSGNIFYKVHWAMFIGGGRDHKVENNLFVDCEPAVRADGRGLDTKPVWRNMVDKFMRARLDSIPLELYRQKYPEMKTLDKYYGAPGEEPKTGDVFNGIPPEGNKIIKNVCIGNWSDITWHADSAIFDIRDNFVTKDRDQAGNPANGFRLPINSPALKMGFEQIPFDKIGIQSDNDRKQPEITPGGRDQYSL